MSSDLRVKQDCAGAKNVNVNRMHAAILREQDEPEDGFEATPTLWLLCMLGLALVSGWYFGAYTANFSAHSLDGEPMTSSLTQTSETKAPTAVDPKVLGKRIYNNCMACHQADGKGVSGQFPPLAESEWVLGDPNALAKILLHGLQGDVQVLGKSYNGVMPAWGRFSDTEIAAVLTYIRSAFGNAASAIEPEVIAEGRKAGAPAAGAWTQTQLRRLDAAR